MSQEPNRIEASAATMRVILEVLMDFEKDVARRNARGEEILLAMFIKLSDKILLSNPSTNELISTWILREYFTHRGDWSAMYRCVAGEVARASNRTIDEITQIVERRTSEPGYRSIFERAP